MKRTLRVRIAAPAMIERAVIAQLTHTNRAKQPQPGWGTMCLERKGFYTSYWTSQFHVSPHYYSTREGSLKTRPEAMNRPRPKWWTVRGFFLVGSIQALMISRTNRQYLFTIRVSARRHSRLA